jgi:type IV pilus assembly protein PilP
MKIRIVMAVLAICTIAACGSSNQEEIDLWMAEQRNQTKPRIPPIAEPKKFIPQNYSQEASIDPYSVQKLTQALKRESTQNSANAALIAPELTRRKEALEGYPLDTVAMVGTLISTGNPAALVKVDNLLYQVKTGNYLGQNYGRINKITETEMVLREIVQDAAGEWIERTATLQLQERSK